MRPRGMISWFFARSRPERWAILIWSIVIGVGLGQAIVAPGSHSVFPIMVDAGGKWLAGRNLYSHFERADGMDLYRYSPVVAMLLSPASLVSPRISESLWRIANGGLLIMALIIWFRVALGHTRPWQRGLMMVLIAPLAASSVHNGQSNPLVLAGMLLAMAAAVRERFNLAAVCITVSFLFKIYPLALGLLLVLVYPRKFAWRLALALAIGLALPYLFKNHAYVSDQFAQWLAYVRTDTRAKISLTREYRGFPFLFTRWRGRRLDHSTIQEIQFCTAVLAAVLVLIGRWRRLDRLSQLDLVLAMGSVWMTLFGPATEAQTYSLLAPVMAWGVIRAWSEPGHFWTRAALTGGAWCLISDQLSQIVPWGFHYRLLGTLPVGGLLVLAGWLELGLASRRTGGEGAVADVAGPGGGATVYLPHAAVGRAATLSDAAGARD